jgi:hypothetical protein
MVLFTLSHQCARILLLSFYEGLAADLEQDAVFVASPAKQQFSDFLADILRFRRQGAPVRMAFKRVQSGHELRMPAPPPPLPAGHETISAQT